MDESEEKVVQIDDILRDHIKGAHILWDGAYCTYKDIEIVAVFGHERPTAIWVRSAMPDNREKYWLKPEDPNFFDQLDETIKIAKSIVDETVETQIAMGALRRHVFGS